MKKLIYLIAVVILPLFAAAQLQNMDFENWENPIPSNQNKPVGWIWTNTLLIEPNFTFYYPPVEDAQSNDYALKLSVWYNYTKDAAIQTAPINYRPASLKGFYRYEDNVIFGETETPLRDTAKISVYLTKFNTTTQSNDTVGSGWLNIGDSVSVYTEFTVDIEYIRPEMPDNITVILDPSLVRRYPDRLYSILGSGLTSFFTVDNLSLVGESTAGITEIQSKNSIGIFPNPAQDIIWFEATGGQFTIFDLTGKQVKEIASGNMDFIDVSDLNKGFYFLRITNKDHMLQEKFEKW
ncbi:T9SS type A sorting domain-containing protein [Fluviicola sp.]|uniref:T9SS type A sorting domain-containing protein n=1 Tax=Fluviicola sp. TaxID=1917219 RepID=UPI0031DCD371